MLRATVIAILFSTSAQANYCIEPIEFDEDQELSSILNEDGFKLGYTSGYRQVGSKYEFTYCIENLHPDSWAFFKWKGPTPNTLIEGYVSKRPRSGRNGQVETWRDSPGPIADAPRDLSVSLREHTGYTDYEVPTIIEDASLGHIATFTPVQGIPDVDLSAVGRFVRSIRNDPLARQQGEFTLSAGVIFDLPNQTEFLSSEPQALASLPLNESSRIRASLTVRYELETLEVTLSSFLGYATGQTIPDNIERVFGSLSLALEEGTNVVGFENIEALAFDTSPNSENGDFLGVSRDVRLGSLADFIEGESPVQRTTIPVVVLLEGAPIYRFNLDIVGPPVDF